MALTGDTRPAEELSRRVGELASAAIADVTHLVGSAVADLFGRPTGEAPTEPAASAPIQAASSVVVDRPARRPRAGPLGGLVRAPATMAVGVLAVVGVVRRMGLDLRA